MCACVLWGACVYEHMVMAVADRFRNKTHTMAQWQMVLDDMLGELEDVPECAIPYARFYDRSVPVPFSLDVCDDKWPMDRIRGAHTSKMRRHPFSFRIREPRFNSETLMEQNRKLNDFCKGPCGALFDEKVRSRVARPVRPQAYYVSAHDRHHPSRFDTPILTMHQPVGDGLARVVRGAGGEAGAAAE